MDRKTNNRYLKCRCGAVCPATEKDTPGIFSVCYKCKKLCWFDIIEDAKEAQKKDTSNQIFKELEKYTTSYGNILLSKAELQTLKKIFKVD